MTSKFLYGLGGHAKVVIEAIRSNGGEVLGAYDDAEVRGDLLGVNFLGKFKASQKPHQQLLISIGDNRIRFMKVNEIEANFFNAVHSKAILSPEITTGKGNVILANTIINCNANIGNHCIINTSAVIEHDCVIKDFAHISPNATLCGNVKIGEGTQVGAGAVILPNLNIGKWVTVGAGAVVIADIPDYAIVVGNPAKIIKYNTILNE